jgi:hypothetical protein
MAMFAAKMEEAEEKGQSVAETIATGKRLFADQLEEYSSQYDVPAVKPHMSRIGSDRHLHPAVRQKMVEMWDTYLEIKKNLDEPRGPAKTYAKKTSDLRSKFHSQTVFISNTLEIRNLDIPFVEVPD